MLTKDDLQKLTHVLATKEDVQLIRADISQHDEKFEKVAETINSVADRVSRLMTREDAISLFDMATLKVEHAHMKKIIHEKLHVEV